MFIDGKALHSRNYSMRVSDSLSGGSDIEFSSAMMEISAIRAKVKKRILSAVKRVEDKECGRAINVAYLDGFSVKDGEVYYNMKAVFQLAPVMRLVNGKGSKVIG